MTTGQPACYSMDASHEQPLLETAMNIHFPQVERKSQSFTHLLVVFAVFTILMMTLSLSRHVEFHWSIPSVSIQTAPIENRDALVTIPAPLPPAEATQAISTPEPDGHAISISIPQAIPAPVLSVP